MMKRFFEISCLNNKQEFKFNMYKITMEYLLLNIFYAPLITIVLFNAFHNETSQTFIGLISSIFQTLNITIVCILAAGMTFTETWNDMYTIHILSLLPNVN